MCIVPFMYMYDVKDNISKKALNFLGTYMSFLLAIPDIDRDVKFASCRQCVSRFLAVSRGTASNYN